ncbi:GH92 family glycosyl hydrolase [Tenacibaculum xiamenense]|uniref:GH92 family glycosyl hydrolase n=1 Tax=Tenacibaculum xiamenense TaxID=1261553 RepID=UPI00389596E5
MKNWGYVLFIILALACKEKEADKEISTEKKYVVDYVNPLMGTDSSFELSNGNTYPAIATPWGVNFWTPMTSKMGDGWTYKYDEHKIRGIKQTHQPSPWLNDYGAFSFMPITGSLKFNEDKRASWFSHKAETAKPYSYQVYLADYDVVAEVAPTSRAAHFQFTFPDSEESYILLDAFNKGSMVKIIPEERKIIGYCKNNHGGVPENFKNYFVAQFDKDFEINHTWKNDWKLVENSAFQEGKHVGAIIGFKTKKGEKVHVKVASSFISLEQATLNLEREIGNDSFEETKTKAKNLWEEELGRIQIKDTNTDNIKTFYSCLYRVLLFPRSFYEINKENKVVHYSPYNGKIENGYMFTDNGFWDTFRAVFPFFNLMYPELNSKIMEGLANTYKESGWLPEWASPGHRNVMVGSNSAPIIADAFLKNVSIKEVDVLFEAILKNATTSEGRPTSNGKVINSVGREGVEYYNKLGYVPYNVGIHENAARTLEYAYADFTIAEMAKKIGKDSVANEYYKRSMNYKKLFDKETKWMRGKNEDGTFQTPFNPLKWGDAFTEGNSLHYTWSVFHDIKGLMSLMGGEQNFVEKLDEVFEMPPKFDNSYYGFTIHEIREMQIVNMGNYAHGNQPIQHMIYLYNYAGKPFKTQEKIRDVLTKLYTPTPDGYCGDEDNGQTSAWYVFSSLGFYPVTPGVNQYVIGAPLFEEAEITLQNGKIFTIKGQGNSNENKYIQSTTLNNKSFDTNWISYSTIQEGGELVFEMGDVPNQNWGSSNNARPYSLSDKKE